MRLIGLLLVIILAMAGVGYWYYTETQTDISILQENNTRLETAIKINEETISNMEQAQEQLSQELHRVNNDFAIIRRQNQELVEKLSDNDLGLLAESKPELINRIIDNASEKAFRCFELMSGAELTEQERNATNGNDFNSECPWIYIEFIASGRL